VGAIDFNGLVTITHPNGGTMTLPNPNYHGTSARLGPGVIAFQTGWLVGYYGGAYYYHLKHQSMQNDLDCSNDSEPEDCDTEWEKAYQRCDQLEREHAPKGGRRERGFNY